MARVSIQEYLTGDADVQTESEEGCDKQEGWKRCEVEGLLHVHRGQQHRQGCGDIESDQNVKDEGGQGNDEHHDDHDDGKRHRELGQAKVPHRSPLSKEFHPWELHAFLANSVSAEAGRTLGKIR